MPLCKSLEFYSAEDSCCENLCESGGCYIFSTVIQCVSRPWINKASVLDNLHEYDELEDMINKIQRFSIRCTQNYPYHCMLVAVTVSLIFMAVSTYCLRSREAHLPEEKRVMQPRTIAIFALVSGFLGIFGFIIGLFVLNSRINTNNKANSIDLDGGAENPALDLETSLVEKV